MKEATGGISIFQIVIVFLILFVGIMALTINHSKSFAVKDEIINIIENESLPNNLDTEILTSKTISEIVNHLNESGYRLTNRCPDEFTGYASNGKITKGRDAVFCIKVNDASKTMSDNVEKVCSNGKCEISANTKYPKMIYYDLILFYQLDIPILKNVMKFEMKGSTKVLFE